MRSYVVECLVGTVSSSHYQQSPIPQTYVTYNIQKKNGLQYAFYRNIIFIIQTQILLTHTTRRYLPIYLCQDHNTDFGPSFTRNLTIRQQGLRKGPSEHYKTMVYNTNRDPRIVLNIEHLDCAIQMLYASNEFVITQTLSTQKNNTNASASDFVSPVICIKALIMASVSSSSGFTSVSSFMFLMEV